MYKNYISIVEQSAVHVYRSITSSAWLFFVVAIFLEHLHQQNIFAPHPCCDTSCWEIFSIVNRWAYLLTTSPSIDLNPKKGPSHMIHRMAKPKPIPEQFAKSHGNIKILRYPEVSRGDPRSGDVKAHDPKGSRRQDIPILPRRRRIHVATPCYWNNCRVAK